MPGVNTESPKIQSRPSRPLLFLKFYLGGRYVWLMSALFALTIGGPLVGSLGIVNDFYVGDVLLILVLVVCATTFFDSRFHTVVIIVLALAGSSFGIIARCQQKRASSGSRRPGL